VDSLEADTTGSAPLDVASPPPPPPPRRRPDRKRTRLQRIVILAAILFVVVFALAWGARSCQQSRKVGSYRTYIEAVTSAIGDSAALGKQLDQIVANPTKYSRKEFIAKLEELNAKQSEIATRAEGFQPPSTLSAEQAVFVEGMKVRAEGFELLQTTLVASLGDETVSPGKVTALSGYFSGPDAYYMGRFYAQTRTVMSDQGVSDVPVPTATYYLTANTFDTANIEAMLSSVDKSAKLVGRHGVALLSTIAQPADVELGQGGKTAEVPATTDLGFEVSVQNQGDGVEQNVAVKGEITLPGGVVVTQTGTIVSIAAGKTESVVLKGFAIPGEALGQPATLKITVGPVPGESVKTNNTATYKILLQLVE
jgi:hypothetical protein